MFELIRVAVPWTLRPPPCKSKASTSSGALDTSSEKVQKASLPRQPDSRTRWCWSALPCPRCRVPRHTANREHTQRSSGAMDGSSRNIQNANAHFSKLRTRQHSVSSAGRWMKRVQNASAHSSKLRTHKAHSQFSGRWRKCLGKRRRRAHISRIVRIHVGVGQRCRARDGESPALPTMSTRNVPAGRWMQVQGRFKRRAHIASPIRVHVGVGQRCRAIDGDSPALQAKKPSA
eukprot:scaffold26587_cov65-Phaeocystis_antarctica.AAC.1